MSDREVPKSFLRSPSSSETRRANDIADIRLGSVQYILQGLPFKSSCSKMKEGTCVLLPLWTL